MECRLLVTAGHDSHGYPRYSTTEIPRVCVRDGSRRPVDEKTCAESLHWAADEIANARDAWDQSGDRAVGEQEWTVWAGQL